MSVGNSTGGGGFGAAAIRAGRAFIEFFIDDKKVKAGLDGLKKGVDGVGGFFQGVSKKFTPMAMLEGTLGRLKERVANDFIEMASGLKTVEKNTRDLTAHLSGLGAMVEMTGKKWAEWHTTKVEPGEQAADIDKRLKFLNAELKVVQAISADENKRLAAYNDPKGTKQKAGRLFDYMSGQDTKIENSIQSRIDKAAGNFSRIRSEIDQLEEQRKRILNPSLDPKLQTEFANRLKDVRNDVRRVGMSDDQKLVDDFRQRGLSMWKLATLQGTLRERASWYVSEGPESQSRFGRGLGTMFGKGLSHLGGLDLQSNQFSGVLLGAINAAAMIGSNSDINARGHRWQQADLKKFESALRPQDMTSLVRGGFNASAAGQQFSLADQRMKEQTDILKQIDEKAGTIGNQVLQALKVL